uniref:NADH-ubiquinone oxidoreductase chain 2 n=1 Tax=Cucujoidea sp. 3 KM-2017 TaxID=2219367 RepID=A0A346RH33_9CUCU|nr:NADH dehydrogenase subunit 2 [Cucujoidea sp. 3 KM-2017]
MYFYKLLFMNTLMLGTLITISSYSWLSMWMGLEINLLSFIPLMNNNKNILNSESSIKYFISQSMASIMLLFFITFMLMNLKFPLSNYIIFMMINSSMFMKMGAAPFHFWFPMVMEGLTWNNSLILLTWQKIAPMILIYYSIKSNIYIMMIIMMCALIGSINGLNQINLQKILAYSSINHMSWMISMLMYSSSMWMMYFLIYSIITLNIIFFFKTLNVYMIKQLYLKMNNFIINKMIFSINFLSLSGLPPFLGFMPKWITIKLLIFNNMILLSFIMIMCSLITLFFYFRLMISSAIFFYPMTKNLNKIPLLLYFINFINLIMLIFMNFILI